MKRLMIIALLASGAWAADFSQMSTEQMMNMRGSVPIDDRPAFQQEMQKRMQSMSPQERQKYMQKNKGMGQGQGMMGQGKGMGQKRMMNQPQFTDYDLNNDGAISETEFQKARAKRMSQRAGEGKMMRNVGNAPAFADIDTNKDGVLTQEEFRLHQTERMKDRTQNQGKGRGQGQGMGRGRNF